MHISWLMLFLVIIHLGAFKPYEIVLEPRVSIRRNFEDLPQSNQHSHVLLPTIFHKL